MFASLTDNELHAIFNSWYKLLEGIEPFWVKESDRDIMLNWIEIELHPDVRIQRYKEAKQRQKFIDDVLALDRDNEDEEERMQDMLQEYYCVY